MLYANCISFVHRQIGDELSGGKTRPTFSELEKQSSCLAATNIVFVMDFANSDGLDFEKPNPNNIALEV